jgi:3-deoxy-7-phosphoheptulonate synthase
VKKVLRFAEKVKLLNPKLLVDTNHDNSGKKPEKQIEIMREVMQMLRDFPEMRLIMKGFMVESYLHD